MLNIVFYKKPGFTLAEILITLGIVGVIAAMAIPPLIMNYQKNVLETQLKKVFSVTTNACERMLEEENVSAVNETELYLLLPTASSNTSEINEVSKKYFKTKKDGAAQTSGNFKWTLYLADNSVLDIGTSGNGFLFYTDINGDHTKPNSDGIDRFEFKLDENCSYDSSEASTNAARAFKNVVDNDWKFLGYSNVANSD